MLVCNNLKFITCPCKYLHVNTGKNVDNKAKGRVSKRNKGNKENKARQSFRKTNIS